MLDWLAFRVMDVVGERDKDVWSKLRCEKRKIWLKWAITDWRTGKPDPNYGVLVSGDVHDGWRPMRYV